MCKLHTFECIMTEFVPKSGKLIAQAIANARKMKIILTKCIN